MESFITIYVLISLPTMYFLTKWALSSNREHRDISNNLYERQKIENLVTFYIKNEKDNLEKTFGAIRDKYAKDIDRINSINNFFLVQRHDNSVKTIQKQKREFEKHIDERIEFFKNYVAEENTLFKNAAQKLETESEKEAIFKNLLKETVKHKLTTVEKILRQENRAPKSAEIVGQLKSIYAEYLAENIQLQSELAIYKNAFPQLENYKEELEIYESVFASADNDSTEDEARIFINAEEYNQLTSTQRNQLALDRYIQGRLTKHQIGLLYEHQIAHEYMSNGWKVLTYGAEHGFLDRGLDVLCEKNGEHIAIQAKCWSSNKLIRENVVFQIFGASLHHGQMKNKQVKPVIITTTQLSDYATLVAKTLNVQVIERKLDKKFPMIKCNINGKDKIYHLPFDQLYNRVHIKKKGEFLAFTVKEAERAGFRRAKRHFS